MLHLTLLCAVLFTSLITTDKTNIIFFREEGRFAGWPANNGIWCLGQEIVVGFSLGYHLEKENGHTIDGAKPQVSRLAHSLDGGLTWKMEVPSFLDANDKEKRLTECAGSIDFTQPNFAMMIRMQKGRKGDSYFYWSNDRCKIWQGPYKLPRFDRTGMISCTDYIVDGPHSMTACLTAPKFDGIEGWPLCVRTTDGGKTWIKQSFIGKKPEKGGYAIMPSTVQLSPTELFTYIRCRSAASEEKKR
ncbi:MAG TPA: hypothetical protein PLN21_14115 [Gemmatales bacterium]|nr:hypothetical protein [Gemmatales bacterium]